MATSNETIDTLLNNTLSTIGGEVSATTPDEGVNLIQQWIETVRLEVSTQWLVEPLEKLQTAINTHNMHEVEELMHNLSGITVDFANNTAEGKYREELQNLSTVLKDFVDELTKQNNQ